MCRFINGEIPPSYSKEKKKQKQHLLISNASVNIILLYRCREQKVNTGF